MLADVSQNGSIGILGVGSYVPDRVLTNEDLSSWWRPPTSGSPSAPGSRSATSRSPGRPRATSRSRLPARRSSRRASTPAELDLVVVATVTPDMFFPSTGSLLASELGAPDAAAYDLSAGCTGLHVRARPGLRDGGTGLARNALVVGAETLSKIINWQDRSTCVLFGDGAGAVVVGRVPDGGFWASSSARTARAGRTSAIPGGGSRNPSTRRNRRTRDAPSADERPRGLQVRHAGAGRVRGEAPRRDRDLTVDDVDLYVPHQANKRIIDHAARSSASRRRRSS